MARLDAPDCIYFQLWGKKEIIAENDATFRDKAFPSLKCKFKSFHSHSRLNVHVVTDFCQKTPKFFQNGRIYFAFAKILALRAFSTFAKQTFWTRGHCKISLGNLFNFFLQEIYICIVLHPAIFGWSPWKVFAKLYWEIYPLLSGFMSEIASVKFKFIFI